MFGKIEKEINNASEWSKFRTYIVCCKPDIFEVNSKYFSHLRFFYLYDPEYKFRFNCKYLFTKKDKEIMDSYCLKVNITALF